MWFREKPTISCYTQLALASALPPGSGIRGGGEGGLLGLGEKGASCPGWEPCAWRVSIKLCSWGDTGISCRGILAKSELFFKMCGIHLVFIPGIRTCTRPETGRGARGVQVPHARLGFIFII